MPLAPSVLRSHDHALFSGSVLFLRRVLLQERGDIAQVVVHLEDPVGEEKLRL
jgi:hypothetical protein